MNAGYSTVQHLHVTIKRCRPLSSKMNKTPEDVLLQEYNPLCSALYQDTSQANENKDNVM